jgi:hypothetical protein
MLNAEEKTLQELFGPAPDAIEIDVMTRGQFDALPTYSCTLPTGTTIGKKWKRDLNEPRRFHRVEPNAPPDWWTGEYVPDPEPGMVGIKWRKVGLRG